MSFITGSITDANPGPALHTLMATALTTAGYTLVDTVVISTRTHKIWKSPAAGNVQNLDWYLDIGYTTTGAGTISLVAFEFFDPATDLGYRGPYTVGVGTLDAATGSRYGAVGYALETNWFGAHIAGTQTTLPVTAFGYWISITADRVMMLSSTLVTRVSYAGFYEPDPLYAAKAGAALFPLYTGKVPGTSWGGGTPSAGITRVAPLTSMGSAHWGITVDTGVTTQNTPVFTSYPLLPAGSTLGYPYVGFRPVLESVAVDPTLQAGRHGWLRDCYLVPATSAVTRGDTATIAGAQHVFTGGGAGGADSNPAMAYAVAFKAA